MRDTITSANSEDFRQRYEGTLGWLVTGPSSKKLVKLTEYDEDAMHFVTAEDAEGYVLIDSGVEFEFIQVKRKIYQWDDGTLALLERVPARQFKRGISVDNTHIWKWVTSRGWLRENLNLRTLNKCMNDRPLRTGPYIKINDYFSIADGKVFIFRTEIGSINSEGLIKMSDDAFKQELADAIRREKFSYGL